MNHDYNPEEWQHLEQLWHDHDRRVEQIARHKSPKVSPSYWWHYAVASCTAAVVVSALIWLRPQPSAPAGPSLTMNRLEVSDLPQLTPTETEDQPIAQPRKTPPALSTPSQSLPVSAKQPPLTEAEPEPETMVIGIPQGDLFLVAAIEGSDQQSYVRCNNRCDAQEILTQTTERL